VGACQLLRVNLQHNVLDASKGDYKLIVHEAYPSRLFNFRDDSGELNDLIEKEPEMASELLSVLDTEVDRKVTPSTWGEYQRHDFAQFQRQARRGLYWDGSYSLRENPPSDYGEIVNNSFTGWTEQDEAGVKNWLTQNSD